MNTIAVYGYLFLNEGRIRQKKMSAGLCLISALPKGPWLLDTSTLLDYVFNHKALEAQ